jgi:iron(III) transport system substrate-binding protein
MAIVKNCPHRAAAEALVNFMTSAEGQSAIAAYEEGTLRLTNANYVVPEGAWLEASADMTWVPRPVNELIERKAELLEHWNELVGQIQG